jgi:hypothetical protein
LIEAAALALPPPITDAPAIATGKAEKREGDMKRFSAVQFSVAGMTPLCGQAPSTGNARRLICR